MATRHLTDINVSGDVTINGSHLKLLNHSGSYEGASTDYLYIGGSGLDGADAAIYLGNAGNDSGYGWRFYYEGTGSGNNNKLIFKSENAGSGVDALSFTQDGNCTFSGTISTASHGSSTNWKQAYDNHITGIAVTGTSTKTITLTQRDGGTISADFSDQSGSGGITMTNGVNNRVVTATGVGSVNGESGLLFGGSYLEITPGDIATPLHVKRTSASTRQVNLLLSANDGSATSEGFLGCDSSSNLRWGGSGNTSLNSLVLTEDNLDFVVSGSTNNAIVRLAGGGTNFTNFTIGGAAGAITVNSGTNSITIGHHDTSSASSVNNSNGTVIQDVTLDTYGHVTALGSVNLDNRYYQKSESESRYVNVTGDTMTGTLTSTQNGGTASIYINSTRPSLGFTDSNSFTDANDVYLIRGTSGNKLAFQWYDNSAATTTEWFSINNAGSVYFSGSSLYFDGSNTHLRSDNEFKFLYENGNAQRGRFLGIQVGQSYSGTIPANGILFGTDTNLYRSAANTLRTNDALTVDGTLTTAGIADIKYLQLDDANGTVESSFQIYGWDTQLQFTKRNLSTGAHTGTLLSLDYSTNKAEFLGDLEAPGIYVGSTNTSYDFYNNGTSYLNGNVTVDANLSFTGDDRILNLAKGTTNSEPKLIIGEQDLYGVSFRWNSGAELEFDGFWNSSVTGSRNRDLGSIDVNNRVWYLNNNVTVGGTLTTPNLTIGSGNKIKFANNDFIRFDDANGVGRFHFDCDGSTNNASVQAATFVGALSGNASTASKWSTARTITLAGDLSGSVSIDGSANVTLTASVNDDSHDLTWANIDGETANAVNSWGGLRHQTNDGYIDFGPANTSHAHIYTDRPNFYFNKELRVNNQQVFHTGYHPNADKWTTARTLTLNGDVTGSVSWDGSANATLTTTVANNSHTHAASDITSGTFAAARIAHNSFDIGDTTAETGRSVHETGIYTFNRNNGTLGTGTESAYYSVLAFGQGTGGSAQIAAKWTGGGDKLYYRSLRDTTDNWWSWREIYHTGHKPTYSELGTMAYSNLTGTPTIPTNYLTNNAFDQGVGLYLTAGSFNAGTDTATTPLVIDEGDFIKTKDGGYLRNLIGKTTGDEIQIGQSGTSLIDTINFLPGNAGNNAVKVNGNTVWNAGNDGSGSGLDADLLDGQQGSYYARFDHIRSLGTVTLNDGTTTAAIISEIENFGGFDSYSSVFKTNWSYAGNSNLSDAGRLTELAGTSWLTWTDNSSDSTRGNITALVIAPNTGGSANKMFVYNDQGSSYSPGWREIWTSASDGAGSGLDADKLDGQQGSYYLDYNNFTNTPTTSGISQLDADLRYINATGDTMGGTLNMAGNTLTLHTSGGSPGLKSYYGTVNVINGSSAGTLYVGTGNANASGSVYATTMGGGSNTKVVYSTSHHRYYVGSSTEEMRLESDGDLHLERDVIAYSTTVSDIKLKDNVVTIDNALDKVCKLRGVEYTWNKGGRKDNRDLGVIAQEVEKVLPEIVKEKKMPLIDDSDTVYKTVDYEKLSAVLMEAVKEQQAQIDELTTILDQLTKQLNNGNNI